ncbi:lipid A deacylase LpxR family protein [Ferrimonas pelagia]|uniref:Lipid A deacylase LpxR family protein n=2 Tax=Ferrimonas pelagia TaxID=1177826 RepID=A0ABP9FIR1_9GAMM
MDNDVVLQTDGDYTNGLMVDYISERVPSWLEAEHMQQWFKSDSRYWHWQLAQKMWTPSDLKPDSQQAIERPYAGTLISTITLGMATAEIDNRLQGSIGVVGPASGAEWVQTRSHKWFGSTAPSGWDDQIENTLLLQLQWEQNRRLWSSTGARRWHWYGHARIHGGNYRSETALASTLMWGQNGGDQVQGSHWQQASAPPSGPWGWAVFAGIEGRYRFNDITLQGRRPDTAPDVGVEHWQSAYVIGLFGHYGAFFGHFMVVTESREYCNATEAWTQYGRLSVGFRFE